MNVLIRLSKDRLLHYTITIWQTILLRRLVTPGIRFSDQNNIFQLVALKSLCHCSNGESGDFITSSRK